MANTSPGNRSGKGRFLRTVDTAERDANAARLRAQGLEFHEIAAQLGYQDPSGAYKAVERALLATVQEPAAQVRAMEIARLNILLRKAWDVLCAKHIVVSQGRVVCDPDTDEPLIDHGPILAAIDRVLKISDHRAKLLGLYAPVKVEAITVDMIEAEMVRLSGELGLPLPQIEARPS
jgi:hypothetical protein